MIEVSNFFRVSRKHPCEICGRFDWCMYGDTVAMCMRKSAGSFKNTRNGGYLHRVAVDILAPRIKRRQSPLQTSVFRASADHLDRVYSELLTALGLSDTHYAALLDRGFENSVIARNKY